MACTGYDIYDLVTDPSWENVGWIVLDIVTITLPIASAAMVLGARTAAKADEVVKVGKAAGKSAKSTKTAKGAKNPKVRQSIEKGQKEHLKFAERVKAKQGWKSETITKGSEGKKMRPDAITPSGRPVELKSDTPSGRKAGKTQIQKYEKATG